MNKRIVVAMLLAALLLVVVGCANQYIPQSTESKKESHSATTGTYSGQHSSTQSSFTNRYGTPTTKCAHTGCSSFIANSGDTNCCKEHSNRCLDCYKYIDEDAHYCVSCIVAAATPTCEACSKTATYTIKGITGQTEYYCTEHYYEMQELLEWLENN